jgi:hypothetical protein
VFQAAVFSAAVPPAGLAASAIRGVRPWRKALSLGLDHRPSWAYSGPHVVSWGGEPLGVRWALSGWIALGEGHGQWPGGNHLGLMLVRRFPQAP